MIKSYDKSFAHTTPLKRTQCPSQPGMGQDHHCRNAKKCASLTTIMPGVAAMAICQAGNETDTKDAGTRTSLVVSLYQFALSSQPSCDKKGSLSVRRNHKASTVRRLRSSHDTQSQSRTTSSTLVWSVRREQTKVRKLSSSTNFLVHQTVVSSTTQRALVARYSP